MKYALLWLSLLGAALAQSAPQSPYLNLDFETSTRGQLWYWNFGGGSAAYSYIADTTQSQSGNQSLQITSTTAPADGALGAAFQQFPATLAQGHHVTVTGWIMTANVTQGTASLFWQVNGAAGVLSTDSTAASGTTGWTQYQIDRDISPDATSITFGVAISGPGTAWFDALQILIDGTPLQQGPAPNIGEPTPDQLNWIAASAIPLAGTDASLSYDDLTPLQNVIGNAHIAGLGDATYGTRQFFQMRRRITDYLTSQMGFTTVAIEANMPEAYLLNDYVVNGKGDPAALIKALPASYWNTWNTQEMLDTIQWMRSVNSSGQGQIQFAGFDMQFPDAAMPVAHDFVAKADPGFLSQLNDAYTQIQAQAASRQAFGYALDQFPPSVAAAKHVRFTGYIKTQGVTIGSAYLFWTCAGSDRATIAFGTSVPAVGGTTDWQRVQLDLDVPAQTAYMNFGAVLAGNGTAWFDSYALEVDGQPYVNTAAYDFDFEAFYLRSLYRAGAGYEIGLDTTVAHTGKQSLRISFLNGPTLSNADIASACTAVADHILASRDAYIAQGLAASAVDWATQNARIVAQAAAFVADPTVRGAAMAANIQWIINQVPPGGKVIIWAHDDNVSRRAGAMGSYLAAQYGQDYVVLGSSLGQGTYNAEDLQGFLGPRTASLSFPGSAEYVFAQSGIPQFLLDLRLATADDPASAWLLGDLQFRTVSWLQSDGFFETRLWHDYDALFYFDRSSPTTLLPF